jgi:hypothetical protein
MHVHLEADGKVQISSGLIREETGLGSLLKTAFSRMGIAPCGGCGRRAEWLDRHIVITPEQDRRRNLFED